MRRPLPGETQRKYLVYAGTGTDLLFNHGVELPGFASFPLLEEAHTRAILAGQMKSLVDLAGKMKMGCILDTPTWKANAARAAHLGYGPQRLREVNRDAVALMQEVRRSADRDDVLVSGCIGPRFDPYEDTPALSIEEARQYHTPQLVSLKESIVDLVTAYTFNRATEAAGCVLAAREVGLPIVVSLVVETDGYLLEGTSLVDAIDQIDAATDSAASFFMVNCAHPTHFAGALKNHPRLKGVVANASPRSHAELNESAELDCGDPHQFGKQMGAIARDNPSIQVFGGCCGTDMRHLTSIAKELV